MSLPPPQSLGLTHYVYDPPHTDTAAILQAAQAAHLLASAGHASSHHSSVIVIGPFEPQIYDLSSSESGSSTGPPSLATYSSSHPSDAPVPSPFTPIKRAGKVIVQPLPLFQSPANHTDWVEYGEHVQELEDVMMCGSDDETDGESVASVEECKASQDEEWALLRLQALQLDRSKSAAPRLLTRPFPKERIIPLKLPQDKPRPLPNVVPEPPLPEMVAYPIPIPTFAPMTPPTSASRDTLVPSDSESDQSHSAIQFKDKARLFDHIICCSACEASGSRMVRLLPCGDLACPPCFSSSVAAVSVSRGVSKCPACLADVTSFQPYEGMGHISVRPSKRKVSGGKPVPDGQTVVMRIDNVAWDIEPYLVEAFLPPNSLPSDHPQPIHICLDRNDGRTKDYMYVEVTSSLAARRVLQKCQNAYMSGGRVTNGRKRAVTVSIVTHEELVRELCPGSKKELKSLLELCEASLSGPPPLLRFDAMGRGRLQASIGPNGKVHYIKYRHAPFHSLLSILSKLRGSDSPAYWDIFHVASGAIVALSTSLKSREEAPTHAADAALMSKLVAVFDRCYGVAARPIQL